MRQTMAEHPDLAEKDWSSGMPAKFQAAAHQRTDIDLKQDEAAALELMRKLRTVDSTARPKAQAACLHLAQQRFMEAGLPKRMARWQP